MKTYHFCTHFLGDYDDVESIEDDIQCDNIEEAKQYVKDNFDNLDYFTLEGNGEWFSSED